MTNNNVTQLRHRNWVGISLLIIFSLVCAAFGTHYVWSDYMMLIEPDAYIVNIIEEESKNQTQKQDEIKQEHSVLYVDMPEVDVQDNFEEIKIPGFVPIPREGSDTDDSPNRPRVLVILEMILVPRHGYIHMSFLREESVSDPSVEVNAVLTHPQYNASQFHRYSCDQLPTLEIEISGERFASKNCQKIHMVDDNLGSHAASSKYIFAEGDGPDFGPFSLLANHRKPYVRVFLDEERYVKIDLASRSAGILKHTTRPSIDYTNPDEYYNPNGTVSAGSMSICSKGIDRYSPYLKYLAKYLERIGISHYYLGFTGTAEDLARVKQLLAEEIAKKFITIITIEMEYIRFITASTVLVMACYVHARQTDIFVANFDTDELPVVFHESFRVANGHITSLPKYLLEQFTNDKMMIASSKLYKGTGPNWNSTAYYEGTILQPRPQRIWEYSNILIQSRLVMAMEHQHRNLTYSLHEDFPAISIPSKAHGPSYIKTIAITAATNTLEVHIVSGIDTIESSGIKFASRIDGFAPPETTLVANRELINTAHFMSMYGTRKSRCQFESTDCFLMSNTTGFAAIMANYSIDSKWFS